MMDTPITTPMTTNKNCGHSQRLTRYCAQCFLMLRESMMFISYFLVYHNRLPNIIIIATLHSKYITEATMQDQRRYSGKRYKSGNILVDWVFLRFIDILNKKIKRVVYRTPLRDPDNPRKRILGVWMRADFIRQFGKDTIV